MAAAARAAGPLNAPHIPVLLRPLLAAVAPVRGLWIDGTLGAGGYARALLEAGADHVIGIDRDPLALEMAQGWAAEWGDRLTLVQAIFSEMDKHASQADGVVLDLGVSSMQLDRAERGFSFQKDGPLDMRMSQEGPSAADLVNEASEAELADILFLYGEERASRRIARAIVRAREQAPITTTARLAEIVSACLPRPKPGQSHPATRSFQALRIAVNDEFAELVSGLEAAARVLRPGGRLAVVSFHSIEDRIVKRFLQVTSDKGGGGSRHGPATPLTDPQFTLDQRKALAADDDELAENPRARSARLRLATRTNAAAAAVDRRALGVPQPKGGS
ncbi:16S rRNA (cytosine(1402)-N(4))-methyltransferase RsmH [Roseovarius amoyensis]|uniref:16S rRNA (cytosine(1402)-N(4))-methyltransferase RsmH n=1 Tax=Roseovarius amoyensis TaxID=2211448 RepID=UPI000DBE126F|nr:16S rRNA (cytosine(1402)-N(4))-methyltransferase RsmH [Roseovarius amoyensis]